MEENTESADRYALLEEATNLPNFIEHKKFISARFDEIEALNLAIGDPSSKGMVFQQLPKHMRRRIMSHTVKRMPRRLREAHTRSLNSTGALGAVLKRPSRKYRRRPSNLLKEYNRRQQTYVWLETHIWHAKRFHMTKKWEYKLADRPNDKSYRACYRAAANHCLLQDLSFMNCIEIIGPYNFLIKKLKNHTSAECGLTFGAKCFRSGTKEGSVMFYEKNKYPYKAIGKIDFLWKFNSNTAEDTKSVLWLWCHPAIFSQVLEQLISSFDLKSACTDNSKLESVGKKSKKKKLKTKENIEKLKLEGKHVPFTRVPKYTSSNCSVVLNVLKDTLNRFRLTGPLSNAALTSAFKLPEFQELGSSPEFAAFDWWTDYFSTEERIAALSAQKEFWSQLSSCASPCQFPPRSVISVLVVDPRLTMPSTRTKAVPCKDELIPDHTPVSQVNLLCSESPLWSCSIRDKVTESKLSTAELGKRRSNRVVPGILIGESELFPNSRVPVLLIQRPGVQSASKRIGFGSGWDLIVPASWGMPVWLGLVFRGCRTGGLRETVSLSREMGIPLFDEADTKAGLLNNELEKKLKLEVYFRRPPAKRLNFISLGIPTPYDLQWCPLVEEWASSSDLFGEKQLCPDNSFYVLRNRFYLDQLSSFLTRNACHAKKVEKQIKKLLTLEPSLSRCLVPVNISLNNGGTLDKYSLLCLPNESDFSQLKHTGSRKRTQGRLATETEIIENKHVDYNFEKRKLLRADHKKLLAKLRRKRVAENKKRREELANCNLSDFKARQKKRKKPLPTVELVKEYNNKMRKLWLPEVKSIKYSNSRTVMGFVTNGAFCYSESLSFGQGYVTMLGLLQAIVFFNRCNVCSNTILVRSYSSSHFRFATVSLMS